MSKKAKIDRAQKAFLKAMKEKFTEDPRTFTDPYDDLVSVLPTRDSGSCPSSSLLRALEEDRACYQAVIDKREHELAHEVSIVQINICVPKCIFSGTCSKQGQRVLDCETVKRHTPIATIPGNHVVKLCCGDPSCHHEIAPTKCRSCGHTCPCHEWEVAGRQQGVCP
jgi:hypothetical protein